MRHWEIATARSRRSERRLLIARRWSPLRAFFHGLSRSSTILALPNSNTTSLIRRSGWPLTERQSHEFPKISCRTKTAQRLHHNLCVKYREIIADNSQESRLELGLRVGRGHT